MMQSNSEMKKRLPLVKARTDTFSLADATAVGKLFEISTTVEAAEYFQQQFKQRVMEMGSTSDFGRVLTEIDKFVDVIRDSSSEDSNYWSGSRRDEVISGFMTYQKNLSEAAAKALGQSATKNIDFDFAMNETSDLIQGFSSNGAVLDENATKQLNDIYSNWLVTHHMICKNGVILEGEVDEKGVFKGETKIGDDQSPARVDPSQYRELFMDKTKGFAAFVKEQTVTKNSPNSGIDLRVNDLSDTLSPDEQKTQA